MLSFTIEDGTGGDARRTVVTKPTMEIDSGTIKQLVLLLWALWLTLVVVLNLCDGLKGFGRLPASFKFASTNFTSIVQVTSIYSTPRWLAWFLFAGAVMWEALAAGLLWRAFFLGASMAAVNVAFFVALGLWGAFILVDEFFLTFITESSGGYSLAATHRSIFTSFLVSLIALHILR
jgi:hypothetical protein